MTSGEDSAPKKMAKAEDSLVKVNGKKLRAGTIPWRLADGNLELLLIEGINTPGLWSFPAGSLDPGEELSVCACRETQEECGASGLLGCFLGSFEQEKSISYIFLLQVTAVEDEQNPIWHDPDSSYTNGARQRRWCSPEVAMPLLKKDGPQMLEAFLRVPPPQRSLRRVRFKNELRLFLLGGGVPDWTSKWLRPFCLEGAPF